MVGRGGEECVSIFVVCHHSFHLINGYRYVSKLLYIHTKLMIVDDRKVIVSVLLRCSIYLFTGLQMGSANYIFYLVSLVPDLKIQICSPCFIDRIFLTSCSPCSSTYFAICWLNIQSGRMPHRKIYFQRVASFQIVYSLNRFTFTCDNDHRWILKSTSLRVYPPMWHPSRLYIEPTDCKICWGTW
jgi:hypothetical protein